MSIVVPTYVSSNSRLEMFKKLITSAISQSFRDFEIVVTDHTEDDRVKRLLADLPLRIKYVRNTRDFGNSSANMNLGMFLAEGELIHIMHCDDWYCSNEALALLVEEMDRLPSVHWGAFAFDHWDEETERVFNPISPSPDRTLGCPSTTFFRRHCIQTVNFDESLIYINDHDFHQSLLLSFGPPIIIRQTCVRIEMSADNLAKKLSEDRLVTETEYFELKVALKLENLQRSHRRAQWAAYDGSLGTELT